MNQSVAISRRAVLRGAAAGIALPYLIPDGVLAAPGKPGPNDRIGIAGIGVGRQGSGVFGGAARLGRFVAVADVNLPRAQAIAKGRGDAYQDYRRVLDRKDVDAITTATTDHWRALVCVHACQAGKDVYAEKPLTLTIREGRLISDAVKNYKRVLQTGSQQRSQRENLLGCELVRNGRIGKITRIIAFNYPSPWECDLPAQPIPDGLDWDMWCGPTPVVPYNDDLYRPRAKPGWISFRPYSGGEMTGWGSHGLDQVQWALGMDAGGPIEVWVEGEKLSRDAKGNAACAKPKVFFRYPGDIVMELANGPRGGAVFIGEKGRITIDRGSCASDPPEIAKEPIREGEIRLTKSTNHMGNWFECMRTRQQPVAHAEAGHRSATVCHLGNIARWLGRRLKWDPVKETFPDDAEANTYLDRPRRKPYELPAEV
ncbi:MAG: Gfo/Idh/MocA family oxidoreductase [Thermoguttaceae bacterium]|jgi:predicted dehydrogenase